MPNHTVKDAGHGLSASVFKESKRAYQSTNFSVLAKKGPTTQVSDLKSFEQEVFSQCRRSKVDNPFEISAHIIELFHYQLEVHSRIKNEPTETEILNDVPDDDNG